MRAQRAELLAGYRARVQLVTQRVVGAASSVWTSLPDYRDPSIDGFVGKVVPVVMAGQNTIASLTDSFFGQLYVAAGLSGKALGSKRGTYPRNADPLEVYRRPAKTVYYELSIGTPLDVAAQRGLDRLVTIVSTDMQLAKTHAARDLMMRSPHRGR